MICADCKEPILESERRVALTCHGCRQGLHAECAVYSEQEDPFCESCWSSRPPRGVRL